MGRTLASGPWVRAFGIVPANRNVGVITQGSIWNYTSALNVVFLVIASVLVVRFLRTGGPVMLRMMSVPEGEMDRQHHQHCAEVHSLLL